MAQDRGGHRLERGRGGAGAGGLHQGRLQPQVGRGLQLRRRAGGEDADVRRRRRTAKAVVIAGCRGGAEGLAGARRRSARLRRARARVFAGDAVEVAEPVARCPASAASGRGRGAAACCPPRQLREAAVVVRAVVGERRVPPVLERPATARVGTVVVAGGSKGEASPSSSEAIWRRRRRDGGRRGQGSCNHVRDG